MQPKQNIHSFLKWILPFFIQILFVGHTRTHFWHCIHVVLSTLNERLLRINVLNPQFAILDNSQAFFLEDNFISNSLLFRICFEISCKYGRLDCILEIASFLDLTPLQIREALLAVNECMSLDDERENERSLYETIPDKESLSIDEKLTLESSIERLSDSEQKIIRYRYFRDLSQSETAKRLGMTQVMVSRYEKKSLERLKKYYEVV